MLNKLLYTFSRSSCFTLQKTLLPVLMLGCLVAVTPASAQDQPPRLILQITVDALRGDLPQRFSHMFGEGGFRYLMDDGVYYNNAHYRHANTETIVGHVSLATGTVPAAHGMVANVWYDREKDRLTYNIEDERYQLLTAGADVDKETEIDPTQKAAKVDGRSPATILSSTFSDELSVHYGGKSKIFGVSVKDRGAVSLAGHAGKAFWFSKATGEFVTSSYFYEQYPEWVNAWNAGKPALSYAGKSWELSREPSGYIFGDADDKDYETDFPGYGRTFPHPFGEADDKYFTTRLTLSPAGDELTLDFAKALLDNEQLGQDGIPDYLAISFSSTDYVGHLFGASSLEMEDNLNPAAVQLAGVHGLRHLAGLKFRDREDAIVHVLVTDSRTAAAMRMAGVAVGGDLADLIEVLTGARALPCAGGSQTWKGNRPVLSSRPAIMAPSGTASRMPPSARSAR